MKQNLIDSVSGPSRRAFLMVAAAAGVGVVSGGLTTAAGSSKPAPGPITLGFSSYGMKKLTTEEAIRQIAAVGYDAVEICVNAGWDADGATLGTDRRAAIRKQLVDSNIRVSALMENLVPADNDAKHAAAIERLKLAAQLAHDLSPDHPPLIETTLGGGSNLTQAKPTFLRRLPDWVKVADSANVVIAIKPHRGNAMNRPEHAIGLLGELGNPAHLKLVYDYSHYAFRDMPMDETIRISLPQTVFVSIKDVVANGDNFDFKLPGETGQIDYTAMLKQLSAGGYSGDFNCEVSGQLFNQPGYDAIEAAKKCYALIAPAFAKAAVSRE